MQRDSKSAHVGALPTLRARCPCKNSKDRKEDCAIGLDGLDGREKSR